MSQVSSPTIEATMSPATPAGPETHAARGSPRNVTLRTYALAAVAVRAGISSSSNPGCVEQEFLAEQLRAISVKPSDWIERLPDYLRSPAASDRPLLRLADELELNLLEVLVVALAAAVEDDALTGRALAFVQAPVGGSRPTLGLIAAAFSIFAEQGPNAVASLITGRAVRSGLLTFLSEGAPLPERPVAVPWTICLALAGVDETGGNSDGGAGDFMDAQLPPSIHREAQRHAAALFATPKSVLVLRTGSRSEGRLVATAIARAIERRPFFVEVDKTIGLGPLLILQRRLPVFSFELAPGERRTLPELPGYDGPVLAICGPDGSIEGASGPALNWVLPVPPREERQLLWQRGLNDDALAMRLASHHRHGTGRIVHLARLAWHQAALANRSKVEHADIVAASWSGEGAGLESLAEPLRAAISDEALVATPELKANLELLLLRCRARDELVQGLGASAQARYRPGVRALLVGPSGTGKTLAAGWLATKLGLPLYRVDLASVTSKYIGETEKNLASLLARAEQSEIILLFDEADSLFGKRTDIKESNDRFANAQTNYLLQRIENFDGIALLTSNSRVRFDSAFARRLDLIIEFAMPGPEERRALWQSHLGYRHELTTVQLNQLAALADLGGGDIRNAVFTAAALAREAARPIAHEDVLRGVMGEFKKLGRQPPAELLASRSIGPAQSL